MRSALIVALATTLCSTAWAQADQDHAGHHPAGASAPTPAKAAAKPTAKPAAKVAATKGASADRLPMSSADMESRMKAMKDMHEKMMTAKTPEERQALMDEHMKAMKDGMGMMDQMKGAQSSMGMGMHDKEGMPCHDMMNKRMDMMEMMMQMMMDREVTRSMSPK